jgi:hypothetical protein
MAGELYLRGCFDDAVQLVDRIQAASQLVDNDQAREEIRSAFAKSKAVVAHLQRALKEVGDAK